MNSRNDSFKSHPFVSPLFKQLESITKKNTSLNGAFLCSLTEINYEKMRGAIEHMTRSVICTAILLQNTENNKAPKEVLLLSHRVHYFHLLAMICRSLGALL